MRSLYSDLNESYPTEKPIITEVEAVYQSLDALLTTSTGERLFSNFGLDLEEELFELNDAFTEDDIFSKIIEAIEKYETRVTVDRTNSQVTRYPDQNMLDINVEFALQGIENQSFKYNRRLALG